MREISAQSQSEQAAPRGTVIAAFAAVYVIWGSTYLEPVPKGRFFGML